eukprot:scaffold17665_cov61-Phaeocystis_antarctica.AAC.5
MGSPASRASSKAALSVAPSPVSTHNHDAQEGPWTSQPGNALCIASRAERFHCGVSSHVRARKPSSRIAADRKASAGELMDQGTWRERTRSARSRVGHTQEPSRSPGQHHSLVQLCRIKTRTPRAAMAASQSCCEASDASIQPAPSHMSIDSSTSTVVPLM